MTVSLELIHASELRPVEGNRGLFEVDFFFNAPRSTYAVTYVVDAVLWLCGFRDRHALEAQRIAVLYETDEGDLAWEELAA